MSYIYKNPNINSNTRDFFSKIYSIAPSAPMPIDTSLNIYNNTKNFSFGDLITHIYQNTTYSISNRCKVWPYFLLLKDAISSNYRNNAWNIYFNNIPYPIAKFLYYDNITDASSYATLKQGNSYDYITTITFSLSTNTYISTNHEDAINNASLALSNFANYFKFDNTQIFETIFSGTNVMFTFTLLSYITVVDTNLSSYTYYGVLTDSTTKDSSAGGVYTYVY